MSVPQRVKVETASYDKDSDMISWEVKLANGKIADLIWRREDFGPTFKINSVIPIPLVEEFCTNMVGKEINLVIDPKPDNATTDLPVVFNDLEQTKKNMGLE